MKLSMAAAMVVVTASVTIGIAACDGSRTPAKAPASAAPVEAPSAVAPPVEPAPATATAPAPDAATPATPGAPAYAAVYPGGEVEGEPIVAGGSAGPGGLVTFTTDAEPEQVVAFYRERAEAAGMASVMSMNQGDARAYGATQETSGASVQVVASPTEDQETSVQLSWSAGE